jgi:regulator of protease activity HflC (stomatin/prohibitin superfamily)
MRADYLTYRHSTFQAILGLLGHAALGVALVIYGVLSRDQAALTAAIFVGVGALAWLTLAIVYDQHRRERVEAMEHEALSGGVGGGLSGSGAEMTPSVFERSQGEEFKVAARRLSGLYKFFVPAMSLVMAGVLIAGAILRWKSGYDPVRLGKLESSLHMGWGLGLGLVAGVLGFVFARFASGMAKQKFWVGLRGGASHTVGAAILGVILAVIHFADLASVEDFAFARYLHAAVPVFLGVIGVEILLNFVLDIYRPRKAGETPAPAFESRLLGFAAAPDRIAQSISDAINYQLGFNVTSGWFYQLLSRSLAPLVIVGVLAMWGLSSLAVLQPHQTGMILRFGRPVRTNIGPGLHVKLPWPIETVYVPEYFSRDSKGRVEVTDYTSTGVRTLQLATAPPANKDAILWTNDHVGEEVFHLVRAERLGGGSSPGSDGLNELALVSIEVPLKYIVDDVAVFDALGPAGQRDDILKAVASREVMQLLQGVPLDRVLGAGRSEVSEQIRERVERAFAGLNPGPDGKARGAGVRVQSCGAVGVHPPKQADVAGNFEKVSEADQRYQARLDEARKQEISSLTAVAGGVEHARKVIAAADMLQAHREAQKGAAPNAEEKRLEGELDMLLDESGGETAVVIGRAKAERWERLMALRAQAARYSGQLAAFRASPQVFRWSMYLETLAAGIKKSRVYITTDTMPDSRMTVDLKEKDSGLDVFRPKTDGQ